MLRFQHDSDAVSDVSSPGAAPLFSAAAVRPSHSFLDAANREAGDGDGQRSTPSTPSKAKADGGIILSPVASFIDSVDGAVAEGPRDEDSSPRLWSSRRGQRFGASRGPSEESEDNKVSQAGLVNTLKTLLA